MSLHRRLKVPDFQIRMAAKYGVNCPQLRAENDGCNARKVGRRERQLIEPSSAVTHKVPGGIQEDWSVSGKAP